MIDDILWTVVRAVFALWFLCVLVDMLFDIDILARVRRWWDR